MSLSTAALATLKAAETAGEEGIGHYALARAGGTPASASSLVRKGLLLRSVDAHGAVTWTLSQEGRSMVEGHSGE